jgi:signal transduction histidine kinase
MTMTTPATGRARRRGVWFLAAASLVASLAFLGLRLSGVSDGAVIPFYADAWTVEGVRIQVDSPAGGLVSGDIVTSVAGRPLGAWLDAALDPTIARPAVGGGAISYGLQRAGAPLNVSVTLARHDVGATLIDYWSILLFTIVLQVVATYVLWRRPDTSAAVALMVAACGVTGSTVPWLLGLQVSDIALGWPFLLHALSAGGLYMLLWPAGALHLPLALSKGSSPLGRRTLALVYGLPLGAYLGGLFMARLVSSSLTAWLGTWPIVQLLVLIPTVLIGAILTVRGYRSATLAVRNQIRWAAWGGGIGMLGGVALLMGPELLTGRPLIPWSAAGLVALPLPLGVAAGILRYRLFDIEVAVNRTLVYGGLTLMVVVVYAGTVSVLSRVLGETQGYAASLLATGVVAVAALPVRDVLQRAINRLMFGDRDEPWRAITRLGQRLEWSAEPQAVFPLIVRTVGEALRLPYVALEVGARGAGQIVAVYGGAVEVDVELPLVYGGEPLGRLLLASRPGEEGFSADDMRLLEDLARQAGAAAHAVDLTRDLQHSRERLVTAREEERRRLRRDLHDGLGPTLAGMAMRAEAAAELTQRDPGAATEMLEGLRLEARGALADIRRLVYELRPPALDELGLVGAVRQQAERLGAATPSIEISAPTAMPPLPAAVEVAAYRIAVEAIANAVRHSGAHRCEVRFTNGDGLTLEITDDGIGLPDDARAGVGLTSMRERAAELGGSVEIGTGAGGGTRVRAWLPLPGADPG